MACVIFQMTYVSHNRVYCEYWLTCLPSRLENVERSICFVFFLNEACLQGLFTMK